MQVDVLEFVQYSSLRFTMIGSKRMNAIKSAFITAKVAEELRVQKRKVFENKSSHKYDYRLNMKYYGLLKVSKEQHKHLDKILLIITCAKCKSDSYLYVFHNEKALYSLLY